MLDLTTFDKVLWYRLRKWPAMTRPLPECNTAKTREWSVHGQGRRESGRRTNGDSAFLAPVVCVEDMNMAATSMC